MTCRHLHEFRVNVKIIFYSLHALLLALLHFLMILHSFCADINTPKQKIGSLPFSRFSADCIPACAGLKIKINSWAKQQSKFGHVKTIFSVGL